MINLSSLDALGPYEITEDIAPSDTTRFTRAYDALYIGDAGTVKIQPMVGAPVTFTVATPVLIPVRVVKVFDTGTDSTIIKGLRRDRYVSPNAKGEMYVVGTNTD